MSNRLAYAHRGYNAFFRRHDGQRCSEAKAIGVFYRITSQLPNGFYLFKQAHIVLQNELSGVGGGGVVVLLDLVYVHMIGYKLSAKSLRFTE